MDDYKKYLKTLNPNKLSKPLKSKIIKQILIYREDLRTLFYEYKGNKTIKYAFIFNAFKDDIYDLKLVLGNWDYSGRIVENVTYETLKNNLPKYKSTTTPKYSFMDDNDNYMKYLLFVGADLKFPNLLRLSRIEYIDEIDPLYCDYCGNKIKRAQSSSLNRKTCNEKCRQLLCSERMRKNNPAHKMSKETKKKIAKHNSIIMKSKIASGEFTPCITNSWSRSRIKFGNFNFRSSWEFMFYLLNQNTLYETTRIPYLFEDSIHTYIVDFTDNKHNIIFEIKPKSLILNARNIAKEDSALVWCEENNYSYKIITEDYLIKNLSNIKELFANIKLDDENTDKVTNAIQKLEKLKGKNEDKVHKKG